MYICIIVYMYMIIWLYDMCIYVYVYSLLYMCICVIQYIVLNFEKENEVLSQFVTLQLNTLGWGSIQIMQNIQGSNKNPTNIRSYIIRFRPCFSDNLQKQYHNRNIEMQSNCCIHFIISMYACIDPQGLKNILKFLTIIIQIS